ncbi:Mu-like prophage FluMu G protein 2 [Haemophilus influenzae]|uniref:phage virion morphogenesis protein n=1 Tax=Haemophilus influenzae TaxID=727 RepID=UPI001C324A87|nr:phage virion morphogenesis protein [Haemophilus influenzae]BBF06616.1 Mu-like prophage FluMu G protein 2 [Haemophilus influenzae]
MIKIEIENAENISRLLGKVAEKTQNRQDLMADLAETMRLAVDKNFEMEGRPDWQGLAHPNKSGKILQGKSRDLRLKIITKSDNSEAIVGSNKVYAAIHQFGGKAGRNKRAEIPKRPFLTLTTEEDKEDLLDDVQDYFQRLIK